MKKDILTTEDVVAITLPSFEATCRHYDLAPMKDKNVYTIHKGGTYTIIGGDVVKGIISDPAKYLREKYIRDFAVPELAAELHLNPTSPQRVSPETLRVLLTCFDQIQQIKEILK